MSVAVAKSWDGANEAPPPPLLGMRLSRLLAAMTERSPQADFIRDQPDRQVWSGRDTSAVSYEQALDTTRRIALFLASLGLPHGAPVGICLPAGSEACLAILAAEQAGLLPCPLPLAWGEDALLAAVEAANVPIVITQSAVGEERPAQAFCRIAVRYFGLRFICAFGPGVPDGVVDLDRVLRTLDTVDRASAAQLPPAPHPGTITFTRRSGTVKAVHRRTESLVTATMTFLAAANIEPGDLVLSLLPSDDLKGLVTGPMAALLSGAGLECHGLFGAGALSGALAAARDRRVHLVAPGWLEQGLADSGLPGHVVSVILVHDAPARFKARPPLRGTVVDVLAFDELALLSRARDSRGQFTLSLDEEDGPARHLLRVRREADGGISFAGPASEIMDYGRNGPKVPDLVPEWRSSGSKADVFAGIVIGVS